MGQPKTLMLVIEENSAGRFCFMSFTEDVGMEFI